MYNFCSNGEGLALEEHLQRLHCWGAPLQAALATGPHFPSLQPSQCMDYCGPSQSSRGWLPIVLYYRVLQVNLEKLRQS